MWHGPLNSRDFYHWNEPIQSADGNNEPRKYSIVAYNREKHYRVKRVNHGLRETTAHRDVGLEG